MPDGTAVDRYTLSSRSGIVVSLLTYGACLQQLWAPDRNGRSANVALGFATLDGYVDHSGHYFGAIVGRYANRIGNADLHPRRGRRTGCLPTTARARCTAGRPALTVGSGRRCRARTAPRWSSATRARTGRWATRARSRCEVIYTLAGDTLRIDYETTTGPADVRQPDEPHLLEPRRGWLWDDRRPRALTRCRRGTRPSTPT